MADITRWDPFAEMATLRSAFDRMFDDGRPWRPLGSVGGGESYFPVDLLETNDDVVVKASLPGVRPEDIDISVTGQLLTLKGQSREEQEERPTSTAGSGAMARSYARWDVADGSGLESR